MIFNFIMLYSLVKILIYLRLAIKNKILIIKILLPINTINIRVCISYHYIKSKYDRMKST